MKAILGREGLKQLGLFADGQTVLVLDYDGTIAPIVARASAAVIPARTKRLLRQVARLYPTAVLSGRKRSDVGARVKGLGFREVVGNHGIEWRGLADHASFERVMSRSKRKISEAIRSGTIDGTGLEIENKRFTLSIHYRMSPHPNQARREILAVLRELRGTQIITGKCVFNLLPATRLNKGTAVLTLRKKFGCSRVIFVGDDWTDEKVFELRPKDFLLDIRVGRSARSRARYYVQDIAEVDQVLRELIRLYRGRH